MNLRLLFLLLPGLLCLACQPAAPKEQAPAASQPNILILYVDDLGYGDLSCYGGEVQTPHIDQLAANGLKFTDAHSASATCTPSRYSLLTGNFGFRSNARVLPGDAPLLIPEGSPTLPATMHQAGYTTAVVGKWHLGLGDGAVDWNQAVKPGPLEVGFDYSFLLPSTGDRVPSVYLENHHVVGLEDDDPLQISYTHAPSGGSPFPGPTGLSHPELLKQPADTLHSGTITNSISRIGFMGGGHSARFVDEEFADVFTQQAIKFMRREAANPFFLYFSFHSIHVPRLPHPRFAGKSGKGPRGDAILQMDWMCGQLLAELDELGLRENTLVIFTSDNGPVLNDGYSDQAEELLGNHDPASGFRGAKYSIYEAGTRMPTLVSWPGKVKAGESAALWSQVDLYATLAELVGEPLPAGASQDGKSVLPALLGTDPEGRKYMVEEAATLALRHGNWKYIAPATRAADWIWEVKRIEGGLSKKPQLYDLSQDPAEQHNLATTHPERVASMAAKLEEMKQGSGGGGE